MDQDTLRQLIQNIQAREPIDVSRAEAVIRELVAEGRASHSAEDRVEIGKSARDLARLIDHTALKPETTPDDVERLSTEAAQYGFASVCVNPCYVPLAAGLLDGTPAAVCSVVGFPLGANRTSLKASEAAAAAEDGAAEIDMVINVGLLKSGRLDYVEADIRAVVDALGDDIVTKVILETALLSDEEKVIGCLLAKAAGADFVKTSTGFSSGGANIDDVRLMRRAVGRAMGVKASGGIRTAAQARAMVKAGATRIGASASVAIVRDMAEDSISAGSSDY